MECEKGKLTFDVRYRVDDRKLYTAQLDRQELRRVAGLEDDLGERGLRQVLAGLRVVGREHQVDEVRALVEASRLVTLLGPGGSGKTSLVDALTFASGSSKRHGSVKDGTALTDFAPEEVDRKYSISLGVAFLAVVGALLAAELALQLPPVREAIRAKAEEKLAERWPGATIARGCWKFFSRCWSSRIRQFGASTARPSTPAFTSAGASFAPWWTAGITTSRLRGRSSMTSAGIRASSSIRSLSARARTRV